MCQKRTRLHEKHPKGRQHPIGYRIFRIIVWLSLVRQVRPTLAKMNHDVLQG
jgi:hypothetical protein